MTKYVFVTGGVVSSLGKGIAAASLAAILESRGLKVTMIKLDPYINVDPGTMSPFRRRSRQRFAPDAGVRRAFQKAETRPPQPSRSFSQQNTAAGSPKKSARRKRSKFIKIIS